MKELLDKLSSYKLFNNLFPGIIFSLIVTRMTSIQIIQKDILLGVFLYYFIGLIISQFGSLVIEPILKKISFLKVADYKDFVEASKKDEKIETLSEANNMYRTIVSMLILVCTLKFYDYLLLKWTALQKYGIVILIILLLTVFLFSYRKQTNYITKRIKTNIDE